MVCVPIFHVVFSFHQKVFSLHRNTNVSFALHDYCNLHPPTFSSASRTIYPKPLVRPLQPAPLAIRQRQNPNSLPHYPSAWAPFRLSSFKNSSRSASISRSAFHAPPDSVSCSSGTHSRNGLRSDSGSSMLDVFCTRPAVGTSRVFRRARLGVTSGDCSGTVISASRPSRGLSYSLKDPELLRPYAP